MKVKCEYVLTLLKAESGFTIARYKLASPLTLPNGKTENYVSAKGAMLPERKRITYELEGELEKYKNSYTLSVSKYSEVIPTEEESIITYLKTLKGVGEKTAALLYSQFSVNVFHIIDKEPKKLSEVKGISRKSAEKIAADYARRKSSKELFDLLLPLGISENRIMKVVSRYGDFAYKSVKENPYCISEIPGISFEVADDLARKEGFPEKSMERIEAGIMEVLLQSEMGGSLFSYSARFPDFIYNQFLSEDYFKLLDDKDLTVTGSTFVPKGICYLLLLKLLRVPISTDEFEKALASLHVSRRIYVATEKDEQGNITFQRVYRFSTAKSEYQSAKKTANLISSTLPEIADIESRIGLAEAALSIRLTEEQELAVKNALISPVSIITGGPGTGKTSVLKAILSVFRGAFPDERVSLAAPTGRAARRMTESSGYPATTIHKMLGLYGDEAGTPLESNEDRLLPEKLIITDEASMMGAGLYASLVKHVAPGSRLILVGDIDQLPSVEIGATLRELISSGEIPVTRLTQTFRQKAGSLIAENAARIRNGSSLLGYGTEFSMVEASSSEEISDKIAELYPAYCASMGIDNVAVLSAFRKNTASGVNALNEVLRKSIRPSLSDKTPHFDKLGVRFYEGDRIMYTKNTESLSNGDIGVIKKIYRHQDGLSVFTEFYGKSVLLEDEETSFLELAYAMTVHKSQGAEYPIVLLVCDMAHKVLLKRGLVYTGISRAKELLVCIGSDDALKTAILSVDTSFRRSNLGNLIRYYSKPVTETTKPAETYEQIQMNI